MPASTSRSPSRSTKTCRLCSGSQPSSRHPVEPALRLVEVLVVAGDVRLGEPRPDIAQRRRLVPTLLRRAVGDVTGMADDVGVELVDDRGDPLRPAHPVDRTVVSVGEEHHTHAVETSAEPGDRDLDPLHPRHPHGLAVAPDEEHGARLRRLRQRRCDHDRGPRRRRERARAGALRPGSTRRTGPRSRRASCPRREPPSRERGRGPGTSGTGTRRTRSRTPPIRPPGPKPANRRRRRSASTAAVRTAARGR